ncbi:hypothetical protein OPT61_g490 [Boeremia exigua]|uniref:Uncharacterized protein n=1 Tax=Boeremia exigua TaxID=749465 RepID=A0ACC2IU04_9PLEO|nr:hypothetical protein OPT61_g490 [Boeremia exigua]
MELPQAPRAMSTLTKPVDWRLADYAQPTSQSRSDPHHPKSHRELNSAWSAVQHDFEQRLGRFGIKLSEASSDPRSNDSNEPIKQTRDEAQTGAKGYDYDMLPWNVGSNSSNDAGIPPLEAPALASLTNDKREYRLETVQRQLQQAQAEVQVWKEKYEAQERNLRQVYSEAMKWRMEYEDLYSAIIQNQQLQFRGAPVKRHGTKSWG